MALWVSFLRVPFLLAGFKWKPALFYLFGAEFRTRPFVRHMFFGGETGGGGYGTCAPPVTTSWRGKASSRKGLVKCLAVCASERLLT